jgi:hypothetical protein
MRPRLIIAALGSYTLQGVTRHKELKKLHYDVRKVEKEMTP